MASPDRLIRTLDSACQRLGLTGRRVLVAVSGGPDSVALLLGLSELAGRRKLELEVATVDHGLRPESADDCAFVSRLARKRGVPCAVLKVEVKGQTGLEAKARKARYAALEAHARERRCDLIATGHTLDDQAETVLFRLARGAGTRGLRGILPKRGRLVRPLLELRRAEVEAYLRKRRVKAREDLTNRSLRFSRNKLRRLVLPVLERALGPSAIEGLARAAEAAGEDERYLDARARARMRTRGYGPEGDARALATEPAALRRRIVRRLAEAAGARLELHHVRSIEAALVSHDPAIVALPAGVRLAVRYGRYALGPERERPKPLTEATLALGRNRLDGWLVEVRRVEGPGRAREGGVRVDADVGALVWRSRRPGDRFRPRGGGEKKLKAFLIDQKIPEEERDALPLLADVKGTVLWVVGVRQGEAAARGEAAREALEVTAKKAEKRAARPAVRKAGAEARRRRAK